jgi:hypothetical protein
MILRKSSTSPLRLLLVVLGISLFIAQVSASYGDRLPEFQNCVEVKGTPSVHRLLLTGRRSASRRIAMAVMSQQSVGTPILLRTLSNALQLYSTASCSGTAQQNATTLAST